MVTRRANARTAAQGIHFQSRIIRHHPKIGMPHWNSVDDIMKRPSLNARIFKVSFRSFIGVQGDFKGIGRDKFDVSGPEEVEDLAELLQLVGVI
jgi:hypothetical protein